jgi:hypothetical protein
MANIGTRGTLPKKTQNFFCHRLITIHTPIESPGRVDKKYFVFKNVYSDFWPKNSVKIRIL